MQATEQVFLFEKTDETPTMIPFLDDLFEHLSEEFQGNVAMTSQGDNLFAVMETADTGEEKSLTEVVAVYAEGLAKVTPYRCFSHGKVNLFYSTVIVPLGHRRMSDRFILRP